MKSQIVKVLSSISAKEYIFIALITTCLLPIVLVSLLSPHKITNFNLTQEPAVALFGIVVILLSVIVDARKSFSYSLFILLILQLVVLVYQNASFPSGIYSPGNQAFETYRTSRNMILLFTLTYIPLHFVVHAIKYFIDKKHKVITKSGLIFSVIITILCLWNFLFSVIISSIIRVFI